MPIFCFVNIHVVSFLLMLNPIGTHKHFQCLVFCTPNFLKLVNMSKVRFHIPSTVQEKGCAFHGLSPFSVFPVNSPWGFGPSGLLWGPCSHRNRWGPKSKSAEEELQGSHSCGLCPRRQALTDGTPGTSFAQSRRWTWICCYPPGMAAGQRTLCVIPSYLVGTWRCLVGFSLVQWLGFHVAH